MGRKPCCSKEGLNRGAWTATEDKILRDYIKVNGEGKWYQLPQKAGLKRCGKSCRLRWLNYLRPDIKRGNITNDEEELIIRLHKLLGNRWSLIAGRLPGRTDNEIKNYWNSNIGKKLQNQQITCSTSHHKQLNPKPTLNQKPVERNVMRARASTCNKVILPPDHYQVNDQQRNVGDHTKLIVSPPPLMERGEKLLVTQSSSLSSSSSPNFTSVEENVGNLTMDFEINEEFMSDLLNTNLSELIGELDNEAASDHNNHTATCDQGYLSPNPVDQRLLFSNDTVLDAEFAWMDALEDSELDSLQDTWSKSNC